MGASSIVRWLPGSGACSAWLTLLLVTAPGIDADEVTRTIAIQTYDQLRTSVRELPGGTASGFGTAASTKTDLDSKIRFLLQGGDLGDLLAEQLAEVDFTLKTNSQGTWKFVGGVETDPEVYPKLASSLANASLGGLKEQLDNGLDNFDVFAAGLKFAPESKESVGRFVSQITFDYADSLKVRQLHTSRRALTQTDLVDRTAVSPTAITLSPSAKRRIAAAVDNRETYTFSAQRLFRKDATGPDTFSLAFTYERPLGDNADSVKRRIERSCNSGDDLVIALRDAECHAAYLSVVPMLENAENQNRMKIALEYKETDAFAFADAMSMFSESFDSTRSFSLTVGYGRKLSPPTDLVDGARLDASFSFEDVKDNAELDDRALLQATYTLKVETLDIPITLTWSNKSELIGDAGSTLGAHVGIQWRR